MLLMSAEAAVVAAAVLASVLAAVAAVAALEAVMCAVVLGAENATHTLGYVSARAMLTAMVVEIIVLAVVTIRGCGQPAKPGLWVERQGRLILHSGGEWTVIGWARVSGKWG
jgi:hypothetical protein